MGEATSMAPAERLRGILLRLLLVLLLTPAVAFALAPNELLLIANRAMPQGEQLARFYAQQRQIPDDRIVLLDLPLGEELGEEQFDQSVILPTRQFLLQHQLREQVRCLVTFYGVPLRLTPRKNTELETAELQMLHARATAAAQATLQAVGSLERAVAAKDASGLFQPGRQTDLPALRERTTAALERLNALLPLAQGEDHALLLSEARKAVAILGGELAISQLPDEFWPAAPASPSTEPANREALRARMAEVLEEAATLRQRRFDATSRSRLRQLMAEHSGLFDQAEIFASQADYLQPGESKALDSELSLLWYDQYTHQRFLPSPLLHALPEAPRPPLLMASRLDAPEPGLVREMILGGIVAERSGLAGKVAIDSRGMRPEKVEKKDLAYARTDESLRQLADRVSTRTRLSLVHDDAPETFKPGAVREVALYVGWYNVRSYTPCCTFVPGAVAYHIASFEMMSLRNASEKGWCRGLLLARAAATVGSVDEPYLFAFPDADEFFCLLMTGRLTLAECYWLTVPLVNWRMVLIGDPLYNPFSKMPALKAEDLPQKIRPLLPAGN